MHRQRQLEFDRPSPVEVLRAARRRPRKTLRQEFDEAILTIAKMNPVARFNQANRELLQQRRQD